MNSRVFFTILLNLVFGNLILYFHEIYGRNQDEVAQRLWLSFSAVAIVILVGASFVLKRSSSTSTALILSFASSFLIPMLGFFVAMEGSLASLFISATYLFYGFLYLILPMWILNFITFKWLQLNN